MSSQRSGAARRPPSSVVKVTSPAMLQLAGRRWFPVWAQLYHRGRRSGKEYVIPVAVMARPDAFVIGLPWGPQTNWVRNVIAAGGCTIRWKAIDYHVSDPQLVDGSVALAAANGVQRAIIKRAKFPAFLQLMR